jgi:hypothetical protein
MHGFVEILWKFYHSSPWWRKQREIRNYLDANLPQRWIGRATGDYMSPRSPDLTPCVFLWGYVKDIIMKGSEYWKAPTEHKYWKHSGIWNVSFHIARPSWPVTLHVLPGHKVRKFNFIALDENEDCHFIRYWGYKNKCRRVSEIVDANHVFR